MTSQDHRRRAVVESYDERAERCNWRGPEIAFGLLYEFTSRGDSILDLGIGTGLGSALFSKAGLRVFGVDHSAEMLAACRRKGFAVDLKQHDLLTRPYPYDSASMDHAVCIGVLDFFVDLTPVFSEVARILADGGTFAFAVTEREPGESVDYTVRDEFAQPHRTMTFYRRGEDEVSELLRQHGFDRLKSVGFSVYMDPDRTSPLGMKAYLARRSVRA